MSDFPAFPPRPVSADGKPGHAPDTAAGGALQAPAQASRALAFSDVFLGLNPAGPPPEAEPENANVEPETADEDETASSAPGPNPPETEAEPHVSALDGILSADDSSAPSPLPGSAAAHSKVANAQDPRFLASKHTAHNTLLGPLKAAAVPKEQPIPSNPAYFGRAQPGEMALGTRQAVDAALRSPDPAHDSPQRGNSPALEPGKPDPAVNPAFAPAQRGARSGTLQPFAHHQAAPSSSAGIESLGSAQQSTPGQPVTASQSRATLPSALPSVTRGAPLLPAHFAAAHLAPGAPGDIPIPAVGQAAALSVQPGHERAATLQEILPGTLPSSDPDIRRAAAALPRAPQQALRAAGQASTSPASAPVPQPVEAFAAGAARMVSPPPVAQLAPDHTPPPGPQIAPSAFHDLSRGRLPLQQIDTTVAPHPTSGQPEPASRANPSAPAVLPPAQAISGGTPPPVSTTTFSITEAYSVNPDTSGIQPGILDNAQSGARRDRQTAPLPASRAGRASATPVMIPPGSSAGPQAPTSQAGLLERPDPAANESESLAFSISTPPREAGNYAIQTIGALAPGRPELARHIALQVASAAPAHSGGQVELRLNPEELGRVRLSLTPGDGTMLVSIVAERGETLDLMRRHINLLAGEFRELGYSDLQFDFATPRRDDDPSRSDAQDDPDVPVPPDDTTLSGQTRRAPHLQPGSGALDLRF